MQMPARRATLVALAAAAGDATAATLKANEEMATALKLDGSKIDLVRFFTLIDKAPGTLRIVTK